MKKKNEKKLKKLFTEALREEKEIQEEPLKKIHEMIQFGSPEPPFFTRFLHKAKILFKELADHPIGSFFLISGFLITIFADTTPNQIAGIAAMMFGMGILAGELK